MENSGQRLQKQSYAVCDPCNSRKVRCDRNEPCGNCQDQETACTRRRSRRRLPKRVTPQTKRTRNLDQPNQTLAIQPMPETRGLIHRHSTSAVEHIPPGCPGVTQHHSWISFVPLTDAQLTSWRKLEHIQGLSLDRHQALESALYVAGQLSESMGGFEPLLRDDSHDEEQRKIPPAEFLVWMLNDIGGDKFGSFVLDYFRHVSKPTLKHMGLSLLCGNASSLDSILYTICANAVAYKFLTTTLMIEEHDELSRKLWQNALQYRKTAQASLKKIPFLTKPSLALLQAILCGIFLYQGSGDSEYCYELTRIACNVCAGLNISAVSCQNVSEEEYYCVLWCYMLDRNYAWKLGRPQCFLAVDPEIIMRHGFMNAPPISKLLLIYLEISKVQNGLIPFLKDPPSTENDDIVPSFNGVRELLLLEMDGIRGRIDQIASPSPHWKGLDVDSEIAALDFAYNSVMITIFHLSQVTPGQVCGMEELYLQSARQELSALVSMCHSGDKQNTVAFLHWTLLYCPLTAYFVLFCNAVTSSHVGDFNLLKTVANCLIQSGIISRPIATLQRLFQQFVSLSQCFFNDDNTATTTLQPRSSLQHEIPAPADRSSLVPCWTDAGRSPSHGEDYFFDPSFSVLDQTLDLDFFLGDGNVADIPPPYSTY